MKSPACVLFVLVVVLGVSMSDGADMPMAQPAKCTGTAKYKLSIQYLWTAANNFRNIPSFPHFSPLVTFTHVNRYSAFSRFGYSTPGVKSVAETGFTGTFLSELNAAKKQGRVRDIVDEGSIINGGGSVSVMVSVSCNHRYISAITMVAPSPDWFLAIFRLSLVKNNKFVQARSGELRVYDAGTDSGLTLMAPDQETIPRDNIAPLFGGPFFNRALARYTITKM